MAEWFENMVRAISPERAWARAKFNHNIAMMKEYRAEISPGYHGGQRSSYRQQTTKSTAREDTVSASSYGDMVANAMNLYRNDPLTKSAVKVVSDALGASKPTAMTSDDYFNKEATEYFNDFWWHIADARRRPGIDYGELQRLCSDSWWYMGDMLFPIFDGSLLPVEGIQIQTPNILSQDESIVNGIRIDKKPPQRATHYYVVERNGRFFTSDQTFKRIRANQAFFAPSRPWRSAMIRGVPDLHAVIDALTDRDKTDRNVQNKIKFENSIFTVERQGALQNMPGDLVTGTDDSNGNQVEFNKVDHGMRIKLTGDPEKDFKMVQGTTPGTQHVPYMQYATRTICAGFGFAMEVALHLYTSGSYTANRAARVDFINFIMERWAWRNKVLNRPVYNWVIAKAIKDGIIRPAPVDPVSGRSEWHKATWSIPTFRQIDEGKEAQADKTKWGLMQDSLQDWAQAQEQTTEDFLSRRTKEIKQIKAAAEEAGVTLSEFAPDLFGVGAEKVAMEMKDDDSEGTE